MKNRNEKIQLNEDIHVTRLVWRMKRHPRLECVKPVNYSLACMSWAENCFRVSQFAIHLYERCFSATQTLSVSPFSFFPFSSKGKRFRAVDGNKRFYSQTNFRMAEHLSWKSLDNFICSSCRSEVKRVFPCYFWFTFVCLSVLAECKENMYFISSSNKLFLLCFKHRLKGFRLFRFEKCSFPGIGARALSFSFSNVSFNSKGLENTKKNIGWENFSLEFLV